MKLQKQTPPDQSSMRAAKAVANAWHEASSVLDAERLQRLRSLTERAAAQQFSQLLNIRRPYPLRPSSGLVEQQRLLASLRKLA